MPEEKKGFFRSLVGKITGADSDLPKDMPSVPEEKETGPGFFERLKKGLLKTHEGIVGRIDALLLGKKKIDADTLEDLEEILISADVGMATTVELVQSLEQRLKRNELQDGDALKNALREELLVRLKKNFATLDIGAAAPFVIMVIGVNGVGKTTTIAKLAAYAKIELKQKVALLTLDTFRLAAVDQLQQYAQILQVPIHVALTVEDLRSALRFYQDRALVLIDTPGHNPKDTEVLDQLRHLLAELPDVETHLVLSATTKPKDLADLVHRFEPLNPTRLIFTKLDETSTYGPILSTLARVRRPLSYLGTGQEVPQDLELATSRRVSDLILPVPAEVA